MPCFDSIIERCSISWCLSDPYRSKRIGIASHRDGVVFESTYILRHQIVVFYTSSVTSFLDHLLYLLLLWWGLRAIPLRVCCFYTESYGRWTKKKKMGFPEAGATSAFAE